MLFHTLPELLANTWSGDIWDLFWYNNAESVGEQLYPSGIHKYFDMHSAGGLLWDYQIAYWWIWFGDICSWFTFFIPLDLIFDAVFYTWDGMEKWVIWYFPWALGINTIVGQFFHVKIENDWPMLDG